MKIASITILIGLMIYSFLMPDKENKKDKKIFEAKNFPPKPKENTSILPTKEIKPKRKMKIAHSNQSASFKGQFIKSVYYVIINYQDRANAFNGFHICDKGVLINFMNGKWLNWVWEEDGFGGKPEIKISHSDQREILQDSFTIIKDVSSLDDWQKLKSQRLVNIDYKFQKASSNHDYITDIIMTFENDSITFCASEEPEPFYLPKLYSLPIANEWPVIVFDEKLLREFKRGIYSMV